MGTPPSGNALANRPQLTACLVVSAGLWLTACSDPVRREDTGTALGVPYRVELYVNRADDAEVVLADVVEQFARVERLMAADDAASPLARLNREAQEGYARVEDADLYRTVRLALDYAQFTRGAYDPTLAPVRRLYERSSRRLPTEGELGIALGRTGWARVVLAPEADALRFRGPGMELDLGPVGRGFALDAGARAFARPGSVAGLLRLGHQVLAWGSPPGLDSWTVDLEDPRSSAGRSLCRLAIDNRGVAVFGFPEEGSFEVLDPASGRPAASDVRVAVAVADSAADAAALGYALLVAGSSAGGDLLGRMHRAEAVLLVEGPEGQPYLLASATLRERLELAPPLLEEIAGDPRFLLPPQTMELEGPLRDWRQ